jgi:YD repeat-containing protein
MSAVGLPVKKVDPLGKVNGAYVAGKVESYTYHEDGSLNSKIDINGNEHAFSYDIFGRLKEKTAGDEKVTYKYDNNNNLLEIVKPHVIHVVK